MQAVCDHPTPDLLAAYQANELTAAENAAIQEHFSQCRECSEMLLDLKAFADPSEDETVEITEPRLTTAWQRLRARLAWESESVRWSPRWLADPRHAHTLSACLLVALLGVSAWVAWLQTEMRRLDQPLINFPIVAIDLDTGGGEPVGIEIPSDAERFLLVAAAHSDIVDRSRDYGLEVVGGNGQVIWNGGGLTLDKGGSLTLEVPRRLLRAGPYRLRLLDLREGRRDEVAARGFSLSYRSPAGKSRLKHPGPDGVSLDKGRPEARNAEER
jgi:hypothetical protein